uniref:Ketosynthase family 3 (KS3) domain-containing protein n=1 Tax=Alexandrium monilatum TaxID=311494 RepID=A0A7S4T8K2_9DINO
MLRMPFGRSAEDLELQQEELIEDEVRKGWVEKHLDFVQRRRLCMMYMIDNSGGTVELYPRPDLNEPPVALSVTAGKLIVFRHDLMTYSYMARGHDDLILQSWFMEQPQELSLGTMEGDLGSFEAIFGGPPQPPPRQVHITAGMGRLAGHGYRLERQFCMFLAGTDCFREIPFARWDMSLYYASESSQFATAGKSVQKHAGLLEDQELIYFDNAFFGISKDTASCMVPSNRLLLEVGYELLNMAGFNKKTLVNADLYTVIADIGNDWSPFQGFENHAGWLGSGATGSSIPTASRLCFTLGIRGPVNQVDTACSASLVGANMVHSSLITKAANQGLGPKAGFMAGHINILTPWPFIGLSGAGMIGRSGRTRTFDVSANGYAKGEGSAGLFLKIGTEIEDAQNRLGCYMCSYINQDGRSASLTAPNGPSQQACIRASMRQGGIEPLDVCQTENHGTGTALGDPIETGSIAAVFRKRSAALPVMSSKTMTGHLEGTAGAAALIKVILSLINSVFCSNIHLRELNAHMMEEGFPGFYPICVGDVPEESGCMGLNAFGFGGTNSRAELWAPGRRMRTPQEVVKRGINGLRVDKLGPASLLPREIMKMDCLTVACTKCLGEMCWLCGAALPANGRSGKHYCRAIREEFASYEYCSDCYEGGYQAGAALEVPAEASKALGHSHRVYMVGTWDACAGFELMEEVAGGRYVGRVVLGDTGMERFHLEVDKNPGKAIFPVTKGAGHTARVLGPQRDGQKRFWTIDGRRDGVPSGTPYEVTLEWEDARMTVRWQALGSPVPMKEVRSNHPHTYSIARRTNGWRLEDMTCNTQDVELSDAYGTEDPSLWEWEGTLPAGDGEEFHFVRDRDLRQCIYPPVRAPTEDVPVVGPDEGGQGLGWHARGWKDDPLIVQLKVLNGDIEVKVATRRPGEPPRCQFWQSLSGPVRDVYCVTGPWATSANPWTRMIPDDLEPDVHRLQLPIGRGMREAFHILVNGCRTQALFPANAQGSPGEGLLCGPRENTDDFNWEVVGRYGDVVEVVLNLAAEDRCSMLTCRPVTVEAEEAQEAAAALEGEEEGAPS